VGILALGGATIVYFASGSDNKAAKAGLGVTPLAGGGAASLSGSF